MPGPVEESRVFVCGYLRQLALLRNLLFASPWGLPGEVGDGHPHRERQDPCGLFERPSLSWPQTVSSGTRSPKNGRTKNALRLAEGKRGEWPGSHSARLFLISKGQGGRGSFVKGTLCFPPGTLLTPCLSAETTACLTWARRSQP